MKTAGRWHERAKTVDGTLLILVLAAIALLALAVTAFLLLRPQGGGTPMDIAHNLETLGQAQASLAGRLAQLAENQAAQLAQMSKRLDDGMHQASLRQTATLHDLRERLAVIDAAQRNIADLSAQVVSLQDILSNKQARGAFGEIQLNDLISAILPPNTYRFQAPLAGNRRVDCLLDLPNPPGPIAIDAKFPLESFHQLRQAADDAARMAASRAFSAAILKHVRDIAEKYIVPGQTADSALMFLPSEAVYAELHANFSDVVEKSFRAKVWIVSPTTLMATLNTVRAVLKDVRTREQAGLIQAELRHLLDDVRRLDERTGALDRHFSQATEDLRQIRVSAEKVARRADRIEAVDLDGPPAHQV